MLMSRLVSAKRYNMVETDLRGLSIGIALMPAAMDMIVEGLNYSKPMEDIRLIPDKSSFRVCPWNKDIGLVFFR